MSVQTYSGVELFPTHLRSTAMAVTLVAARLGAILGNTVFALFLEVQCAIPILMVASLLVGKTKNPLVHIYVKIAKSFLILLHSKNNRLFQGE